MKARFLLLSLAVHALLATTVYVWESRSPRAVSVGAAGRPSSMEVRSVSEKDFSKELAKALDDTDTNKLQQIVQGDDQLKSEKAPETDERIFASKHNQVVDRNTRAARIGKFKNVLEEGVRGDSNDQRPASAGKSAAKVAKLFDIGPHARDLEPLQAETSKTGVVRGPASLGPRGDGFSATDDHLADIAIGANTLLNTREYKFYGFYERIREKISDRWQSRLADAFQELWTKADGSVEGEHVTQVQVELEANGSLRRVVLLGSSGVHSFDRAATDAFREAAPFPNPPTEMVEAQGLVRIRWDFVVTASADTGGIQVQVRRGGI